MYRSFEFILFDILQRSIGDPSTVQHEYLFIYLCCTRIVCVVFFFFFLRRRRTKKINRLSHDDICFIINVYNSMLSHGFKLHEDYYCIFYLLYGIEKQINNYRIMETCVFRENNCILFKRKYPIYISVYSPRRIQVCFIYSDLFHLFLSCISNIDWVPIIITI